MSTYINTLLSNSGESPANKKAKAYFRVSPNTKTKTTKTSKINATWT